MSRAPAAFVAALDALPEGTFTGRAGGKHYIVTKSRLNAGRSIKLVAEERGGSDYVSLNLYHLQRGPRVFPCEMPLEKVIDFACVLVPDR